MARCLLGVFVVTAGLVALASVARGNFTPEQKPAPTSGSRLRDMEAVTSVSPGRTVFRVLPTLNLAFSLN
jgi:hypothetical protein